MDLSYKLDDKPPLKYVFLYGLQWFVVAIPIIVILGRVTSEFYSFSAQSQTIYMQRLVFIMGITILVQVLLGHGLPMVAGPSSALLVGLTAGLGASTEAAYSAIMVGGGCVFIFGITGAFKYLKQFFTHRIVTTIVFLIAASLLPTVVRLVLWSGKAAFFGLIFSLAVILVTVVLHQWLRGVGRSTVIIWVMMGASLIFYSFFPIPREAGYEPTVFSLAFLWSHYQPFRFDFGVYVSFFFCFFALTANEVGSVQSVIELVDSWQAKNRVSRSLAVTGLANLLSGIFGVLGPVNYSLSPGVISSSRCASRYPLIVTAALLLILSFSPATISRINLLPGPVIGAILAYLIGAQAMAGVDLWRRGKEEIDFDGGLKVTIPVIIAAIVSFVPAHFLMGVPPALRPIVQNGFVCGLLSSFILEGFGRLRITIFTNDIDKM